MNGIKVISTGDLLHSQMAHCEEMVDYIKKHTISLGCSLVELEKLFKLDEVRDNYEPFNTYLENLGVSNSFIKEAIVVARYLKDNKLGMSEVENISLSKLLELSKNKIILTPEIYEEIATSPISHVKKICKTLKDTYQN